MTAALLLVLAACRSHTESDASKGVDTGAPPDSHTSVETDSPAPDTDTGTLDTDTGETADTGVDTDSGGDTDTAPPPCDRSLGWKYVAAGEFQTCGIHTNGCAECWGRGEAEGAEEWETGVYHWHGEDQPPPGEYRAIALVKSPWSYFDTPNACAVLLDGTITCWGAASTEINEPPAGSFVDVAVARTVGCGIDSSGSAIVWGSDEAVAPSGTFADVEAGYHVLFLGSDGKLVPSWLSDLEPATAPNGTFTSIGVGDENACALREDGSVLCWDPDDAENAEYEPMTTDAPTGPFTDICVLGGSEACALSAEGDVSCWVLGGVYDPPEGELFDQLACGYAHACGVTPDGRIVCWGHDLYGETTPPT